MGLLSLVLACAELAALRFADPDPVPLVGACASEVEAVALYRDADGDDFGDGAQVRRGCLPAAGWTDRDGDCDDANPALHPEQPEQCNEIDDDCDLTVDEAPDRLWCADVDLDGFGDPGDGIRACEQPGGYVSDCSDCDDRDAGMAGGC